VHRRVLLVVLALVLFGGCTSAADDAPTPEATACIVGLWQVDAAKVGSVMGLSEAEGEGALTFSFGEQSFDMRWDLTMRGTNGTSQLEFLLDVTYSGTWSGSGSAYTLAITDAKGQATGTEDGEAIDPITYDDEEFDALPPMRATCRDTTLWVFWNGEAGDPVILTRT